MGKWKLASDETKRLEVGEDWLDVRTELSRKSFNRLLEGMPNREFTEESGLTPQEGMSFATSLFKALVVGWSLPIDPTVENYENLVSEAAQEIDSALVDHFGTIAPSAEEVSKVSTSQGTRRKGTTRGG